MCGIAGLFQYSDGASASRETLGRLLSQLIAPLCHRGPDDAGVHAEGPLGLAHSRLSIIDVAGGHQPLFSEDRSVAVVCNGEMLQPPRAAPGSRRAATASPPLDTECDRPPL